MTPLTSANIQFHLTKIELAIRVTAPKARNALPNIKLYQFGNHLYVKNSNFFSNLFYRIKILILGALFQSPIYREIPRNEIVSMGNRSLNFLINSGHDQFVSLAYEGIFDSRPSSASRLLPDFAKKPESLSTYLTTKIENDSKTYGKTKLCKIKLLAHNRLLTHQTNKATIEPKAAFDSYVEETFGTEMPEILIADLMLNDRNDPRLVRYLELSAAIPKPYEPIKSYPLPTSFSVQEYFQHNPLDELQDPVHLQKFKEI